MATITGTNRPNLLRGTAANDILRGLGGNDSLFGLAGNDRVEGGLGNDRLDGGVGNDVMIGGAGNDTYFVNAAGDRVIEGAGGGTDTVFSRVSFTLGPNVEHLVLLGSGNINGTGNALNNSLTGTIGANNLRGLGGNDMIISLGGHDRLEGGTGNDTYVLNCPCTTIVELPGAGTDLIRTPLNFFLTTTPQVENLTLIGTGHVDGNGNGLANVITGNNGRNALSGAAGNDQLFGLGGDDRLDGATGDDFMAGGAGNDIYVVDSVGDVVSETGGGIDTIITDLTTDLGTMPQIENLTLRFGANGTGNGLANVITGNENINVLSGLGGNDILIGGGAADRLTGGAGADVFRFLDYLDSDPTPFTTIRSVVIEDFGHTDGDKIDLHLIDINVFTPADEVFNFVGNAAFSGSAPEVRFQLRTIGGIEYTAVQADTATDSSKTTDMEILLVGNHTLVAGDFVL